MKQSFGLTEMRCMTEVKAAAYKAPVLITDNNYPAFVFMTLKQHSELEKKAKAYDKLQKSTN